MELPIKGLSTDTNNKLKEKAKKANMSKNQYIIKLLDTHVISDEVNGVKTDYEELVKSCLHIIQKNTEVMKEFIRINQED